MKRVIVFGAVGFVLVAVSGCGGPDSLMKEYISHMNDLAASVEKKEPADKQKAIADKMKAVGEKLEKLNLNEEQKKKLVEKHKADLEAASQRLAKAMFAQMAEGGPAGMPNLKDLMGGFGPPPMGKAPTGPAGVRESSPQMPPAGKAPGDD
jgi:hypothetical protein